VSEDQLAAPSAALGAIALLASASYAAWLLRRPERAGRRELFALGIAVFSVAAALLVTAARVPRAPLGDALAVRFVNWSALFWAGAALALPSLVRGPLAAAAVLAIALVSIGMLPALERNRASLLGLSAGASEAALGVLLGIREPGIAQRMGIAFGLPLVTDDPDLLRRASPRSQLERFERVIGHLRRERRSLFREPRAELPGAPLRERFALVPMARCRGEMQAPAPLAGAAPPAARIHGWARDVQAQRAASWVVVADEAGQIRGLGSALPETPAAERHFGRDRWSGYLAPFEASRRYTAFAVLADGRSACPLGRPEAPRGQSRHPGRRGAEPDRR
jgi:hypothetical protein